MASAFKNHALRMAAGVRNAQPSVPEKLKGGRLEKILKHLKSILEDYRLAAVDAGGDMRSRPLKASIYLSTLATVGILASTKPSESDFRTKLINNSQDLLLVAEPVRNPGTDSLIQDLNLTLNDGKLHCTNLGVATLVWKSDHSSWSGLFSAQCKQVKPTWSQFFHKQIVDVGVFGRWLNMDKAMVDYDVNPEEWNDNGHSVGRSL